MNAWLSDTGKKALRENIALPYGNTSNARSKMLNDPMLESNRPTHADVTGSRQHGEALLRRAVFLNRVSVVVFPGIIALFLAVYGYLAWRGLTSGLGGTVE